MTPAPPSGPRPEPLFDSHCHLDFPSLAEELDGVLSRAREAGVRRMTTIGAGRGLDSARAALEIARAHAGSIVASVGLHPHDARLADEATWERLAAWARDPLVVAIGETGLDFHYDNSPRSAQREVFRRTIALAREVDRPLIIHTRKAARETLTILAEERAAEVGGISHCFSEDAGFAKAALDLGFVSSFSGIVTYRNAHGVHEAARALPPDAILVETDAPFLAPQPVRGRRNEPGWIAHVAAALAALRSVDEDTVRRQTWNNACRVYRLDGATAG